MADDSDSFDCPICFEVPTDEIYQCKNGHIICRECSESITLCPQCRVKYGEDKIRNRALEVILDKRIFDCPNKLLGCTQTLLRKSIGAHVKSCQHRDFEICEELGFNCKFAVQKADSLAVVEHFQKVHNSAFNTSNMGTLILENFKEILPNKTKLWTPLLSELTMDHKVKFFLTLAKINASDQTLSVGTTILGNKEEHASYHWAKYSVATSKVEFEPLEWSSPVQNLDGLDRNVGITSLRLPLYLLQAKYLKDDSLEVSVNIQGGQDNKPNEAMDVFYALPDNSNDIEPSTHGVVKRENQEEFVPNNTCNVCNGIIKGTWHHCLQCQFYDLCDNCAQQGIHSHHLFTKVTNYSQTAAIYRLKFNSLLEDWLPLVSQDEIVERNIKCSECQIPRTKQNPISICVQCTTFYGICNSCKRNKQLRSTCVNHKLYSVSLFALEPSQNTK